jgi:hypothetical protein
MSLIYDSISAAPFTQNYVSGHSVTYPTYDQIAVMGPVYLPKIYGKDLTSFEIASSGSIAMTLSDVRALTMDRASNVVSLSTVDAGDSLSFVTSNNVSMAAGGSINVSSSNFSANSSNLNATVIDSINMLANNAETGKFMQLFMDNSAHMLTLASGCNAIVSASNVLTSTAPTINIGDANTSNVAVSSINNFGVTAGGITMTSASNYTVSAPQQLINMDSVLNTLTVTSSNNTLIGASNVLTLSCGSINTQVVNDMIFSASNSIFFGSNSAKITANNLDYAMFDESAANKVTIVSTSNISMSTAAGTITSTVSGSNIFVVDGTGVQVNGTLRVNGVIDAVTTHITELAVADKTINLSVGATDDSVSTLSGITVVGLPASITGLSATASNDVYYGKSFKWNAGASNQGALLLGTAPGLTDESFWELQGGSFRMTQKKPLSWAGASNDSAVTDERNVSFAFRINENAELEIVKIYETGTFGARTTQTKAVARFGRSILL